MPLSANPDDLVPYVLITDRDKAAPPTFMLRYLTGAQFAQARRIVKEASDMADDEQWRAAIDRSILIGLADVRNLTINGKPVTIADPPSTYLTPGEMSELSRAIRTEPNLSEQKKRNSASPSTSDAVSSAAAAPPPASASTAPPAAIASS